MSKDYSQITLKEAIDWAERNTKHDDVCKRIRSRAVCRWLLKALCAVQAENWRLREQLTELQK